MPKKTAFSFLCSCEVVFQGTATPTAINVITVITLCLVLDEFQSVIRGTQREYSSKPLKHSIVKRILEFKR